jgi:hypothetical protein
MCLCGYVVKKIKIKINPMPKINQTTQIDVTPEKFLNACSETELIETMMLLSSAKYDSVFNSQNIGHYTRFSNGIIKRVNVKK